MLQTVLNTRLKVGDWLVVVGAGGGLGHIAGKEPPPQKRLRQLQ
jgi:D-arabinose 1-dehydrogenase-like Zn-dependent alcohol dehydrogenase